MPFFQCKLEDSLHLFEGLNNSLAQSPGKFWNCKDLPNLDKLYIPSKGKSTWHQMC